MYQALSIKLSLSIFLAIKLSSCLAIYLLYLSIYSILFSAARFCSVLFYSILFYSILFNSSFVSSRLVSCRLFSSLLFSSLLFSSILFCSILFYSILFPSIPFDSILFYSILFYSFLLYLSDFPKVVQPPSVCHILTWKCSSRHRGVHFFDIYPSESGPNLVCFKHFDLDMCFSLCCSGVQFLDMQTSNSGPSPSCF